MEIRTDLYMRESERELVQGDGPVRLWMPGGLKCKPTNTHARELASGTVVCAGCLHGPCALPKGIEHGREIKVLKEKA